MNRRAFLTVTAASAFFAGAAQSATRSGRGKPPADLGVQLWMVRQSMARDFGGTLSALAALGVRKVELAGAPERPAAELRSAMDAAGLVCVSGHLPILQMTDAEVDRRLEFATTMGMKTVVAPTPGRAGLLDLAPDARLAALIARPLTADDWRWNADRLNALGERTRAVGLAVGYHNHNVEFASLDGQTGMDLLLSRVDPAQAHFQIDVGNAVLGGADPVALLQRWPGRFKSAHLKDWRAPLTSTTGLASPPSAAFGEGLIDWTRWRAASARAGLGVSFIERENLPIGDETAGAAQALQYFTDLQTPR